jgi:hypothetical protein
MAPSEAALSFLDAIGLSPSVPTPRFFEDLFLRFSSRVAYETLTRHPHETGDFTARQPFDAEGFFREWVEEERGVAGARRALAFAALARELTFDVRLVSGRCLRPLGRAGDALGAIGPHVAVLALLEGRRVLADPVFPVPVLLPIDPPAVDIPSPLGKLSVVPGRAAGEVRVLADVRGNVEELCVVWLETSDASPPPPAESRAPGAFALKVHDDRILFWSAGRMTVLDPWSRLTYPLPAGERAVLAALFGVNLEGALLEAPALSEPAVLTVYDSMHLSPAEALERLGTPEGHLTLRPDGTRIENVVEEAEGFVWTVAGENGRDRRSERIVRHADGVEVVHLAGDSPVVSRRFVLQPRAEGTRLSLASVLARPVPAAGPGESVRKTLVFHLVTELLALSKG